MHKLNQEYFFKKVRNYLKKLRENQSNDNSYLHYLNPNSNLGVLLLKSILGAKQNFFLNFITVIKETLYSLNYINYKIFSHQTYFNYKKLIITWGFEDDFKKDGSFFDRYFKINSKNLKDSLWIVIYKGKNLPRKIQKNIFIIKPFDKISFNIFPILKLIFVNLHFLIKDKNLFISSISNQNFFANIFYREVNKLINKNVSTILIAYEGQIFQNKLLKFVSKNFKNITSIGYVHSPPMAAPYNLIYKESSPKKIVLSGKDQIHCFTKYLGWKKSKIIFLPSFRFNKLRSVMVNKIFLPLSVLNEEKIFQSLKILHNKKILNLKKFKIKNHPMALNTRKNNLLVKHLKTSLRLLQNNEIKNYKNNSLIFIGISGAIIEALENGFNVIHISDDPQLDIFSEKFWPSLKKQKIYSNIFSYKLVKKQHLIKFGKLANNKKNIDFLINHF
tara:strand:+ start:590 stop:1924 length:1335 start_codon:yes stop_codon:yes gene_type:complete